MTSIKLSSYKITWIEIRPINGVVTLHDSRTFGEITPIKRKPGEALYRWFVSKQEALSFISNWTKKLDKTYEVRLFTDKQFGMRKESDGYKVPFTSKQLAEVYHLPH